MKRGAPMKRKPFRTRQARVAEIEARVPHASPTRAPRVNPVCAAVMAASSVFRAAPKHEYVRSEALRLAYREIPCQHCGSTLGVVCAHSNWHPHAKGMGIKADDNRAASLCWVCHYEIDQGNSWNERHKKRVWWDAHCRTIRELVRLALWPRRIPVPDLIEPKEWDL